MFPQPALTPAARTPDALLSVALTGNIASGKSEVTRILSELGATIIDADELAREAVLPGKPALAAIAARWGEGVIRADGSLDRAALRAIVFENRDQRDALNAIIHPEVRRRRDELVAEARTRGDAVVVSVIPLLHEVGLERQFDRVILVDAPEAQRLERLVRRRGLHVAEARRMMAAQTPATEKRPLADIIIDNDADLATLREKVEAVWSDLTRSL